MFTGMDSLLAHGHREALAREIDSGRLERKLRALWPSREIEAPASMRPSPKIRHLRDAGFSSRT
jgi:hypothetical protein